MKHSAPRLYRGSPVIRFSLLSWMAQHAARTVRRALA